MIEYLLLLVALLGTTVRARGDLVAENLLLRQQPAVLSRPTRRRPQLRARDKLFWLLARLTRRDWLSWLLVPSLGGRAFLGVGPLCVLPKVAALAYAL